jgi:hypothetical protein
MDFKMIKSINIKTKNPELYLKITSLNIHNEIILSNTIPSYSLKRILNNIGADNIKSEVLSDGKILLTKKKDFKINSFWSE